MAWTELYQPSCGTRGLLQLELDPNKQSKYEDFIESYAALSDNERKAYQTA